MGRKEHANILAVWEGAPRGPTRTRTASMLLSLDHIVLDRTGREENEHIRVTRLMIRCFSTSMAWMLPSPRSRKLIDTVEGEPGYWQRRSELYSCFHNGSPV